VGAAAALGAALRTTHAAGRVLLTAALLGGPALVGDARAQQRFVILVSGATGGEPYTETYARWTETLTRTLVERMKVDPRRVTTLSEAGEGPGVANADNVRRVLRSIRQEMEPADLLLVVLIGHGTFDGADAKFNLVGPDLGSAEWAALLRDLPGRLVLVNTTAASFPFIERLAGPRRIVITATDSVAQKYDTVFPDHFIAAFGDEAADIDKNGRISIWEAFAAATNGVRRFYQTRGQLATERALLDDNGDGVGREAAAAGDDGSAASRTYLDQPAAGAAPTDEVLLQLLQKRASLEGEIEELRIRRSFIPQAEYQKEFERIMIELARVARDIRRRVKS
jgi:hypothetical protein